MTSGDNLSSLLPSGQKPGLSDVQMWRKIALFGGGLAGLAVLLTGGSVWRGPTHAIHEHIETVGVLLIIAAILGRTWCSLYIGGRKKTEIVDSGPYSLCRNPLYLFTFIGAAGIGAQFGSLAAMVALSFLTWIVFSVVVDREERYLSQAFGAPYRDYCERTPRFLPDFRLWRDQQVVSARPTLIVRTFLDASLFLLAWPVAEGIEHLQRHGFLPVWWLVY